MGCNSWIQYVQNKAKYCMTLHKYFLTVALLAHGNLKIKKYTPWMCALIRYCAMESMECLTNLFMLKPFSGHDKPLLPCPGKDRPPFAVVKIFGLDNSRFRIEIRASSYFVFVFKCFVFCCFCHFFQILKYCGGRAIKRVVRAVLYVPDTVPWPRLGCIFCCCCCCCCCFYRCCRCLLV